MLETPEERVKLLRAGYTGKEIEKLYIEGNNLKIVRTHSIIELVEFDIPHNKETCMHRESSLLLLIYHGRPYVDRVVLYT